MGARAAYSTYLLERAFVGAQLKDRETHEWLRVAGTETKVNSFGYF